MRLSAIPERGERKIRSSGLTIPSALHPTLPAPPQSSPTTAPLHPRAASSPPTETEPATAQNISPPQSPRPEKSPPVGTPATLRSSKRPQPCASPQTKHHRRTQTKDPVPPPDTSPVAQTAPAAARSCTTAPDQTPPETHPAAVCAPPPLPDGSAQTAPPPRPLPAPAPTVRDENTPPSAGRNSPRRQTPP